MSIDPSSDDFNPHPFEPSGVYDAGYETCAECGNTRAWPEHSVNYSRRWPSCDNCGQPTAVCGGCVEGEDDA